MVRFFPFQMNYVKSELLIPIPLIFLRSDHIFFALSYTSNGYNFKYNEYTLFKLLFSIFF